jgi:coenzyme F420-0:L-glutamate ligase/coenzyme F420-1:gamma-L-glutamate ligase
VHASQPPARICVWSLPNIPEITAGDDLGDIIWQSAQGLAAQDSSLTLTDGDIVVVTSKIVSKSEGRQIPVAEVGEYLDRETVRVVARREHQGGETRIVENKLGIVAAAAGIDQSNTPNNMALLLPENPDRSAQLLLEQLRRHSGMKIGVLITDTLGRAWRIGQTDAAIGAAGIRVIDDLRGTQDDQGRTLEVTETAVADEIASAADLVKRKSNQTPVAIVRGLAHLVTDVTPTDGARSLIRPSEDDLFRLGTAEASAEGYAAGYAAGFAAAHIQGAGDTP